MKFMLTANSINSMAINRMMMFFLFRKIPAIEIAKIIADKPR